MRNEFRFAPHRLGPLFCRFWCLIFCFLPPAAFSLLFQEILLAPPLGAVCNNGPGELRIVNTLRVTASGRTWYAGFLVFSGTLVGLFFVFPLLIPSPREI